MKLPHHRRARLGPATAVLAFSLLGAGNLPVAAQLSQNPAPQPQELPTRNILLIVLDDLGTDKLAAYGETPSAPYPLTPRLDQLAQAGILFRNFHVNPVCSTTRACFQTGRYAFRTGMGSLSEVYQLPDSEVLVAELLKRGFPAHHRPHRCGAFGKWHLGQSDPAHAVRNGYDRFYGTLSNDDDHFDWTRIEHDAGSVPRASQQFEWSASVVRQDAAGWINSGSGPFFAYVAFNPPHQPFQVPPKALLSQATRDELALYPVGFEATDAFERELFYRASIEALDREIGNLFDQIAPRLPNTMVFVVGDNGTPPELIADPPHDPQHGKTTVYELGIRVPMIVAGPLVSPQGVHECYGLVEGVDLWRTIAELTGASPARAFESLMIPPPDLDGRSFKTLILDPSGSGQNPWAFSQLFGPSGVPPFPGDPSQCFKNQHRAITDGEYKYIRKQLEKLPPEPQCADPVYTHELYRVATDPEEATNLVNETTGVLLQPNPGVQAILDYLRNEMLVLSGD